MLINTQFQFNNILRSDMAPESDAHLDLPPDAWRVFDAYATPLPGTPASDDLGLVGGTHGTNVPIISSGDCKALGTTTRRARLMARIPWEYQAGGNLYIRARGGMITTVAGTSATIDFEAFKATDGGVITGSDLVTTSATSLNSLTWANYDFAINTQGLVRGDELDIRATITIVDAATATAVIAAFRAALNMTRQG